MPAICCHGGSGARFRCNRPRFLAPPGTGKRLKGSVDGGENQCSCAILVAVGALSWPRDAAWRPTSRMAVIHVAIHVCGVHLFLTAPYPIVPVGLSHGTVTHVRRRHRILFKARHAHQHGTRACRLGLELHSHSGRSHAALLHLAERLCPKYADFQTCID